MKRNGLRALGLVTCAVVLASMVGFAAVDLESIVANELIPEVSKAAGLALVNDYTLKTVEELEALKANGRTPGLILAADRALFILNGREMELFEMEDAALLDLAVAGDRDAADMWFFNNRASFNRPEKVEAYLADGVFYVKDTDEEPLIGVISDTLRIAAGKLLGGFYVPASPLGAKTEAELVELAKTGEDLGLRTAAATALTSIWNGSQPLTIDETRKEILAVTLVSPDLAKAYQGYLAYLFSL